MRTDKEMNFQKEKKRRKVMQTIKGKKMYVRPDAEELVMSDGIGLLRGSWKQDGVEGGVTPPPYPKDGMFVTREEEFGDVSDF